MSLIKPLDLRTIKNQTDSAGKPLQVLDEVHRVALMNVGESKTPGVDSQFFDPTGIGAYYGFGRDGYYYEAGVQGRTWIEKQCIDDFTDRVTDSERWDTVGASTDFEEGGVEYLSDTPFGKRAYVEYTGPGTEVYDRKGRMVFTHPASGTKAALSARVRTNGDQGGSNIENSMLLGIQQQASDTNYVFAGFCHTSTYSFSLIMGEVVAGVVNVTGSFALPVGTEAAEIAIVVNSTSGNYEAYYNLSPDASDYTSGGWNQIAAPQVLPAGWPSNAVPRLHAEFPAGYSAGLWRSISDVRVEVDGGEWEGQQRASWYLETGDASFPANDQGTGQEAPDKIMVLWERSFADGENALTLLDVSDPDDILLWRRWRNLPPFIEWTKDDDPFWSPGWIDADEGHIVMTRNTTGTGDADESGEIWLFSLRWDTVVVWNNSGLGRYSLLFNSSTDEVLRETGTWGSRQFYPPLDNGYVAYDNYCHLRQPESGTPFVGTYKHRTSEAVEPCVTYGVNIRGCDNGVPYIAYGIQGAPATLPGSAPCFAGVIGLEEGSGRSYERFLFQLDGTSYNLWDATDEGWVGASLSYSRALWWHQAHEPNTTSDLVGALSRSDWSAASPNNLSTSPITEDVVFTGQDRLGMSCLAIHVLDSDPVGSEIVTIATGTHTDSWGYSLWYNPSSPSASQSKTFGYSSAILGQTPKASNMDVLQGMNYFPQWFNYFFETNAAALKKARITGHRIVGAITGVGATGGVGGHGTDPKWSAYAQWQGKEISNHQNSYLRAFKISRGEMAVQMKSVFSPPWSFGYRSELYKYLSPLQTAELRLFILGERRLYGYIGFKIEGQPGTAPGRIRAVSGFQHFERSSSQISYTGEKVLGSWAFQPGASVQLKIKRIGSDMLFYILDVSTGTWDLILSASGIPMTPLLAGMEVIFSDAPAAPSGACMWEITDFEVAPVSDPIGGEFLRPVDRDSLGSAFSSVQGIAPSRLSVPVYDEGSLIIGEGWFFPLLPPQF